MADKPKDLIKEFQRYLKIERGLADTTVGTYGHHVRAYLKFLSARRIDASTTSKDDVFTFFGILKERGLRSCTLFCATIALKSFYRFLIEKGRVTTDPTVGLPLPKLSSRLPEPLSAAEVDQLMRAPALHRLSGLRDRAILEILFCGLRISEALGLNLSEINLAAGYVTVLGKRSKPRLVPVGKMAITALEKYLEARSKKFGDPRVPLFLSRLGTRLTKGSFWRRLKTYAHRAGIKRRVYPHLLRHSAHAFAQWRCRSAGHPGNAGTFQNFYDGNLHPRRLRTFAAGLGQGTSEAIKNLLH